MKTILISTLFLSTAFFAAAQSSKESEAEIRKMEQAVVQAILDGDTTMLKQLWAPEFMVNTPRNGVAVNRDAVLRIHKSGLIDYTSFDRVIEHVQFQNDVVITMGSETLVPARDIPGAKAGQTQKRRVTNIWAKKNGRWQQIARHASVICQPN